MMDFPAYVPVAVREYITALIEGYPGLLGWWEVVISHDAGHLASLDIRIEELERRLATLSPAEVPQAQVDLSDLRRWRTSAVEQRDETIEQQKCLWRLASDLRMREAYAQLTREFSNDQQWHNFIEAAWMARIDYSKHRDALKRAVELKDKIADAAETLAELLFQFHRTGVGGPREFYFYLTPHGGLSRPTEMLEAIAKLAEAARDFLPSSPYICRPAEVNMIGAAIQSRQRSPKTEYLRAFGNLLTDTHGLTLTTPILKAIAIVANVVINLPDVDVTYDDVRKALAKLGVERMENSDEK